MIIGITGNSGAGKDTVSMIVKNNLDALIVDADNIMKRNQKEGTEYYDSIIELFGNDVLKNDKTINRKFLAKKIFSDEEARDDLNELTFECVQGELDNILLENKDRAYIILNFPLLYEGNFDKICDYVIAVTADEDTKIKRIMIRDKISKEDALRRISSQKTEDYYKSHADFIIDNSNKVNYGDLIKETLEIIDKIKMK